MTVEELQELLTGYDPEAVVLLNGEAGRLAKIESDEEDYGPVIYFCPD